MSVEEDRKLTAYGFQSYNDAVNRLVPGPGAGSHDIVSPTQFEAHLIPEYPTPHLINTHNRLYNTLYTPEGLKGLDVEKREWINMGLSRKAIRHELAMRGQLGSVPAHPKFDSPSSKVLSTRSRAGGTHRGYSMPAISDPELTIGFDTDHGRPTGGADFH